MAMQLERRALFVRRSPRLAGCTGTAVRAWGSAGEGSAPDGQRILVIDDRVPHDTVGFGDPRALALLRSLVDLGHSVTLFPVSAADEDWARIYEDVPREVEVMLGYRGRRLAPFFRERAGYYDCVIVSRSHNMALLRAKLGEPHTWMRNARVIYDAEAITATRELGRRRLRGETVSQAAADRLVAAELALARGVDVVLAVSQDERRQFEAVVPEHVHIVRHAIALAPTASPFVTGAEYSSSVRSVSSRPMQMRCSGSRRAYSRLCASAWVKPCA